MEMERMHLIVNVGSTSKKYTLYYGENKSLNFNITEDEKHFKNSSKYIFFTLKKKGLIKSHEDIYIIGFRIVAPGVYFLENRVIDSNYIQRLKLSSEMAPLHIKPTLNEIQSLRKIFTKTKFIGVSDSVFHKNTPNVAKLYAIPSNETSKLQIYRYGYHGISIQSVLRKFTNLPKKVIVCHLGGGCSITAVKNSRSLDTSMGFTPLEGVTMSTRVGNIDAGALIYLNKKLKLSPDKLEEYLNTKCGLLGLSGASSNLKKILELNNLKSNIAVDHFVYSIKKYIGSYYAALNGLDLLIFTGAIGEHSHKIRSLICKNLESLGIILDENENLKKVDSEGFIHSKKSKVKIAVLEPNESNEILREIKKF